MHQGQLAALAAAFSRLPERRRRRCSHPVTGDSATDTLVLAEADDGSASYEGVVVARGRDEAGAWLLDAEFTILTTDVVAALEVPRPQRKPDAGAGDEPMHLLLDLDTGFGNCVPGQRLTRTYVALSTTGAVQDG